MLYEIGRDSHFSRFALPPPAPGHSGAARSKTAKPRPDGPITRNSSPLRFHLLQQENNHQEPGEEPNAPAPLYLRTALVPNYQREITCLVRTTKPKKTVTKQQAKNLTRLSTQLNRQVATGSFHIFVMPTGIPHNLNQKRKRGDQSKVSGTNVCSPPPQLISPKMATQMPHAIRRFSSNSNTDF
ncbi:MAG: hypothetical protein Ct9H300mP26_2780 [Acidimicrobiales bacterium]|nr:MAG: hypothetical protein Ct9H300mP26_2780 [Acidimicrobiales bacterium]